MTFRLGINYWPARTAMGWWPAFERAEVEADFANIAAAGFDSLRLFLTWEHFQPAPNQISTPMVDRLVLTLELAQAAGLVVMPTLFTGHMSGVNWLPTWTLGGAESDPRFRVISDGRVVQPRLRNWYSDAPIVAAQAFLARELAAALAGHSALWAWDLGNENSNCVVPPTRSLARDWLRRVSDGLREGDGSALVTIGLHMEDLEQDRRLGPAEAAEVCDFLTMHGYPGYATWARGPTDEALLPFLAQITRWLGRGAEVVFSEFGVPTHPAGIQARGGNVAIVDELTAASYVERALDAVHACGCLGAMLWCYSDYLPEIWDAPPLDAAVHERSFGQWRADGSPKPALASVRAFAQRGLEPKPASTDTSWLDIEPSDFYRPGELPRLYQRFCAARAS